MTRLFLFPNSKARMPYASGYSNALKKDRSVSIIWDRFNLEKAGSNEIVYRDGKVGMSRNILDYLKFSVFVFFNAPSGVSSVVFFGPQIFLFCFPKFVFAKWYLDVRDWHPALKMIPSFLLQRIDKFFVSSSRFLENFKVDQEKIVLSHNCWRPAAAAPPPVIAQSIKLSYIGSIRDFTINSQLISRLACCPGVELYFYGDGASVQALYDFATSLKAGNIKFKGKYDAVEEDEIYQSSSMVSSLIPPEGVNNKALITNRLYNAVRNYRPILVIRGTHMAEIVDHFGLGLVVDSVDELPCSLHSFFDEFDFSSFKMSCDRFLNKVRCDQSYFYDQVDKI